MVRRHGPKATKQRPTRQRRAGSRTRDAGPLAEEERLLTVREVAARLRVSPPTVYSMIGRGELRAILVRGRFRLRPGQLAMYMRVHEARILRLRARRRDG